MKVAFPTTDTVIIWLLVLWPVAFLVAWAIKVFRHRHPLTTEEVHALARKRQKIRFLSQVSFSTELRPAAAAEKKAMKSEGQFVSCDLPYYEAPARIAGLLKYKKHEWIVVAFIRSNHVRTLWWNKGPDGTKVWLLLRDQSLRKAISSLQPEVIAILHNHPSSSLGFLNHFNSVPSEADLRSAGFYDREFSKHRINLLEFICDRGVPHLYFVSFDETALPVGPIVSEIQNSNGTGMMGNYRLRMELKLKGPADHVAGGTRS